jgi:phosphomethylpyrimidine synthase
MKITQEVREFALLNPSPLEGEGDSAEPSGVKGVADANAGMAEMSKRFHEEGGELYVPAAD